MIILIFLIAGFIFGYNQFKSLFNKLICGLLVGLLASTVGYLASFMIVDVANPQTHSEVIKTIYLVPEPKGDLTQDLNYISIQSNNYHYYTETEKGIEKDKCSIDNSHIQLIINEDIPRLEKRIDKYDNKIWNIFLIKDRSYKVFKIPPNTVNKN